MKKKLFFLLAIFFCALVTSAAAYDLCGDKLCGDTETSFSCRKDCPTGSFDNYCDKKKDGYCDRDCLSKDSDCETYSFARDLITNAKSAPYSGWRFFFGIASFFAIFFLVIHMVKRYKKQKLTAYDQGNYNQNEQKI